MITNYKKKVPLQSARDYCFDTRWKVAHKLAAGHPWALSLRVQRISDSFTALGTASSTY